jgi:hypothetical protein
MAFLVFRSGDNVRDILWKIVNNQHEAGGQYAPVNGDNLWDLARKALQNQSTTSGGGVNESVTSETEMLALSVTESNVGKQVLWLDESTKQPQWWELIADIVTADTPGEFRRVDTWGGWVRRGV